VKHHRETIANHHKPKRPCLNTIANPSSPNQDRGAIYNTSPTQTPSHHHHPHHRPKTQSAFKHSPPVKNAQIKSEPLNTIRSQERPNQEQGPFPTL
ncbi:hypothetical protein MHBO_004783, partial [Bonamia ostreae]